MRTIALAGNPNCGKTTLFNVLTGSTARVGNWPGVTVDKREGAYKKAKEPLSIIDLPGIYSLSPYTPEEVVSRNYILNEKPDCIINLIDSTNFERNLYLTTQLLELNVPIVVALNMTDVLEKEGKKIDIKLLEKELGVPVIAISAQKGTNLEELMNITYEASLKTRKATTVLYASSLKAIIEKITAAYDENNVENSLFHAIKLIEMDEIEVKSNPKFVESVSEFKKTYHNEIFGSDLEAVIADSRYNYITNHYIKTKVGFDDDKHKLSTSDKADRILTHKFLGIPIFLLILFAIFHLTFSENFLFLGGLLRIDNPNFAGTMFEGLFFTESGINSPGVILTNFVVAITDWLTGLASSGLDAISAPSWVNGFLCAGILGGLFAVIGFLPQILTLFLCFSILEDSGYMARVAFILDRIFRKFGLTGRAFMPMIMGFGCSIPAMINTRTLAEERERVATIRVIPFFSCGAKLPILTAIAGGIIQQFTGLTNPDVIVYSMYILGMVIAIISILIMRKTTMRGKVAPFIMELPAYHAPQPKVLMFHLWDKLKHFIQKAFTIILASTILIWVFTHFTFNWQFLADENMDKSILAGLGQLITPIFTPLGFGSQLANQFCWVFVVAALTGLIAKENVIATFGTLGACVLGTGIIDVEGDGGVSAVAAMIQGTGITWQGLIAFIVFNMTTIPCFAAVATAKAELPNGKFGWTLIFWLVVSYIASMIIYLVLSWWWTSFIFLIFAALFVVAIVRFNKRHPLIN